MRSFAQLSVAAGAGLLLALAVPLTASAHVTVTPENAGSGPVPDVEHIVFVTHQTYSDGEVVTWSDTSAGASEPAPALYVNDTPPSDQHAPAADGASTTHDANSAKATSSADPVARGLGIGGLGLGAIAAVAGIAAFRRKAVN